jgi:hypothetical protein
MKERPRALAKPDLMERLWPQTYVADTNLATLVAEIREATNDDADDPRVIRTVHRFGYAFCGSVTEPQPDSASSQPRGVPLGAWVVCEGRQIQLPDGEHVIGRDPEAAVWIDSSTISRRHARVVISGLRASVEDLGSKNGTHVRGRRITAVADLADGDEIRVGSVVVTFRMPSAPGSTVSLVG